MQVLMKIKLYIWLEFGIQGESEKMRNILRNIFLKKSKQGELVVILLAFIEILVYQDQSNHLKVTVT